MTWAMAGIGLAVLLAACSAFFIRRRKRESNRRWSWADNWSVWDREKLKKVLQEEEPDIGAAKFLEILPSLDQEETDWWRKTLQELGWEAFFITSLTGPAKEERLMAIEMLGFIDGPNSLWPLMNALTDKDDGIRFAAAASLKKLSDPRLLGVLIDALEVPERWLPARVAEVLIATGSRGARALAEAFPFSRGPAKKMMLEILGEIGDESSFPILLEGLKDPDASIRARALKSLGQLGEEKAIPYLERALAAAEWEVRGEAASALGRLQATGAVSRLEKLMEDEDWRVRAKAAKALEQISCRTSEYSLRNGVHPFGSR